MKKIAITACACIVLAGCSKHDTAAKKDDARVETGGATNGANGHFTISSPKLPDDPVARKQEQERLVDSMVDSKDIDLETLQGEAFRRGVVLTPSQIARKKAALAKNGGAARTGAPAPAAPPPPSTN